jgi:glycosyltransferase involved in cell wall biosynthesis
MSATSIDLDTRDLVSFSNYKETTQVIAETVEVPFEEIHIVNPPNQSGHRRQQPVVSAVVEAAARSRPDVIVVQQRLPLAAQIAQRVPDGRVVLRAHTFQKTFHDRSKLTRGLRRGFRKRLYEKLGGIIHVSQACAKAFASEWPEVNLPSAVIGNGLDFSSWRPQRERSREVLCVARCAPEKGVLEAAQATATVLGDYPDWTARFILAEVDTCPQYWQQVKEVLGGLENQVSIEIDQPHENVQRAFERAAIALVPSKWIEPFGRTALEAHAGGAALISSGTGGLSEISGNSALILPEVTPEAIEAALKALLDDETRLARLARAGAKRARELFDIRAQAASMDRFSEQIACR